MEDPQQEMKAESWWMLAFSTVTLLLYVHSMLSAVQASRETGPYGNASGLSKLPIAIVFGTLGVVPLASVLLRRDGSSGLSKWIAAVLLMLVAAMTLFGWSGWGGY